MHIYTIYNIHYTHYIYLVKLLYFIISENYKRMEIIINNGKEVFQYYFIVIAVR